MGGDPYVWAVGGHFNDPDEDPLSFTGSAEYPGVLAVWRELGGAHPGLHLRPVNLGTSEVYYTVSDGYGGVLAQTYTVNVGPVQTRSVREGSAAGTAVGSPVTAITPEGETLSYTLAGEAADAFVVDSATGQIRVKTGATLDYETKTSYAGKVEYSTTAGTGAIRVTINLTDVQGALASAPTVARTASAAPMNPALDVSWSAPTDGATATGYKVQYRTKAAEGEQAASWTPYTYEDPEDPGNQLGTLAATTTGITLPDRDAGATYEVQVRAVTQNEGDGPWSDTGEGTANRPPAASSVSLADATLAWKTAHDYDLADKFTDADGDELSYAAAATYPGVLTVAVTGDDSDTLRVTPLNPPPRWSPTRPPTPTGAAPRAR